MREKTIAELEALGALTKSAVAAELLFRAAGMLKTDKPEWSFDMASAPRGEKGIAGWGPLLLLACQAPGKPRVIASAMWAWGPHVHRGNWVYGPAPGGGLVWGSPVAWRFYPALPPELSGIAP